MTILRRNVALVMIALSIFVFTIAVTLDSYSEIMDVTESAFAVNFLALFSILFMAVGIYLAFSNKPMLRKTRAIILRLRPADVAKNPKEGAPVMATHSYKNHEIEVSTRDNGDFIEASAKFKPMHGYLGAFSMWSKFSSLEAAERTVLEEAKRIIDNRSK